MMKRGLLLVALACAPVHPPPAPPPEPEPVESCSPCPPAKVIRVPAPTCKLPLAPILPEIAWTPEGCPVRKFGACLSPGDLAAFVKFLKDEAAWKSEVARCSHGR